MKEYLQDSIRVFVIPVDIMDFPNLTIHEQMVYMVLRSFVNPRDNSAFPSYTTIARLGRMSRRQAIRCVQKLLELKLLDKENRFDITKNKIVRQTSNLYTIKTPKEGVTHSHQCHTVTRGVTVSHSPGDCESLQDHNYLKDLIKKYDLIDHIDEFIKKYPELKKNEIYTLIKKAQEKAKKDPYNYLITSCENEVKKKIKNKNKLKTLKNNNYIKKDKLPKWIIEQNKKEKEEEEKKIKKKKQQNNTSIKEKKEKIDYLLKALKKLNSTTSSQKEFDTKTKL